MNYWAMRTDGSQRDFFWNELNNGRLRQGWGYKQSLALTALAQKLANGDNFTQEEQACWRGNRRLLPTEEGAIRKDDIVVLPNLPSYGVWSIAKITTDHYQFSIPEPYGDYGHYRDVSLVTSQPINPYSRHVSAYLRGTMRCRSRLWSLSYYEADVNELLTAIRNNEDLSTPSSELERLSELHRICSDSLIQTLRQHYRGEEFEQPLKRVLSQLYSREATVEHVGGRAEEGADFLLTKTDDFGNEIRTVIQVKMWEGESDLREAMEQLEHACNAQRYKPVSSAVILTTLDSLSDGVESHRKELEDRLGVPISVLLANETTNLFFRALPEIVANPER